MILKHGRKENPTSFSLGGVTGLWGWRVVKRGIRPFRLGSLGVCPSSYSFVS